MDREELLSTLKKLDEEVFAEFQDEVEEQRFTLSLIPTVNAESPFAAYLEGSILANVSTDYHGISRTGRFERMAANARSSASMRNTPSCASTASVPPRASSSRHC